MNQVKDISDKHIKAIEINGVTFMVAVKDIATSGIDPVYEYSVKISPDYNASAGFIISAKSIKKLIAKIAKVNYQIVKPTSPF